MINFLLLYFIFKVMIRIIHVSIFWLIIVTLSLLPLSFARFGISLTYLPQIDIGFTFFASIYTRILPIQFFLYGLLIDVAYGTRIGISALILLVINRVIFRFRANLSKQDMKSVYKYFIATEICSTIFKYGIFAFEWSSFEINFKPIMINLFVNTAFYPILHIMLMHSSYVTRRY